MSPKIYTTCFLFLFAFPTFSAEKAKSTVKVIDRLGDRGREEWQLLKATEGIALFKAPSSTETVLTLKTGDEVLLVNYEEHVITEKPEPKSEFWLQVQTLAGMKGWTARDENALEIVEPVIEEKLTELTQSWKGYQKLKSISWKEARELLEKKADFQFATAFRPRALKGSTYPQAAFYYLSFSTPQAIYKFNSCQELDKLIRKDIPLKSLGQKPYEVRYNSFAIETDAGYKSGIFLDNCSNLTELNTYECPNYTETFENVLSKVGPLLTLEYGSAGGAGCGPSYSQSKIKTIDLRTGKVAEPTTFFEKASLLEALLNDFVVKEKLEGSKDSKKDLESIVSIVQLGGFAVFEPKLKNEKVRIRWSLEAYECGMCPNDYQWLGLDVKPAPWFADELKKLNPKKELFL